MSEAITVETQEALEKLIEDWNFVVVDFSAPGWCIPCQRFEPHFKKAASVLPNAIFALVDVDNITGNVTEDYGIMSVPTVQLFKNGYKVADLKGRNVNALVTEIEALIA